MVVRRIILLLITLCAGFNTLAAPGSVSLHFQMINNFPVKYVAVNMNDPDVVVTTAVATSFPYGLDRWSSFINRLHPDAAINGTYFCPHSYQPVGDVALQGALLYRGSVGTAFCITPDNHVDMLPGPRQAKSNWHGYNTILCAGPRLLTDGIITINARAEGFRDPHVLGSATRSALALRADNVLLLLTVGRDISLGNMAQVCLRLGAVQAMLLDGGSSSALYAEGRTVTSPSRSISNIIAVYSTRQRYAAMSGRIAGANPRVLARLLSPLPTTPAPIPEDPTFVEFKTPTPPTTPIISTTPLVVIVEPKSEKPLRGKVPVTVKISKDSQIAWCSLRINGQFRAMSNTSTLEYLWDSTKDPDGTNTLEISAWSTTKDMIAHESRDVTIRNTAVVAGK